MPKVKVRVAVGVDNTGDWNAYGTKNAKDKDMMGIAVETLEYGEARYFIEAELDVPETDVTVPAQVEKA